MKILNAAEDDWEPLDQIFLSVRFEHRPNSQSPATQTDSLWRQRNEITLLELANTVCQLVQSGYPLARREGGTNVLNWTGEEILKIWFHTSEEGRQKLLLASPTGQ